ncbi:prolipoprotein diacylglyceryl transferase [Coralloluteibacterium stylophorae]|uniref:Phosphatidylglycerol--prolipoprotein diacylglyceryl transferase n=1 Tax=Coralloluteibacterium stylophorae TaxID=1776034 RepID=A0A8J7VRS8_9GAMM|nr:prolipoprotein diacylglyceryl transferase [Coralloluteibacterium stylophorae]MBS7456114.1 prolipoprotein diacylglyceryl transferase [Coralloluteibacterium stylophorae]
MVYLHQIDPIALSLGPLAIHWYGLMYLAGFVAAWFLGRARIRQGRLPGVDENGLGDLFFAAMLGVVVGGRIGYVLFYDFGALLANPLMLFRVWEGGMSFHGGLLGVLVAGLWWSRRAGLHFFDVIDFLAPLVPPGLGFGRLGNFIGGELWGKFTGAGWGVVFPNAPELRGQSMEAIRAMDAAGALEGFARHPSQLYQAGLEGLAMFLLLWWFSRRPRPRYAVSGLFAILYGCFRILVEFVRVPDAHIGYLAWGWVTEGQLLSVPLIAIGVFLLWLSRRAPTVQPLPPSAATPGKAA